LTSKLPSTNGDIAYLTKGISHLLFIPYTNGDIAYIYITEV
jgi:hypothetical protein